MKPVEPIEIFRQKLKNEEICVGCSITFRDPLVTDALGDSVDFFWIDLEHCTMSAESLSAHLLAAHSRRKPAVVRVQSSDTPFIKSVLDAGADGIIVPQIKSVNEVISVVRDCRYYPMGNRGYGPRVPSNYGRNGGKEYLEWSNKNIFVGIQIETKEALKELDRIIKIPGYDSIVIGPNDLASSLGFFGELNNKKVLEAIIRIIKKSKEEGLFVGIGMPPIPEFAQLMIKKGVQWIQIGGDFEYLIKAANEIIQVIKRENIK